MNQATDSSLAALVLRLKNGEQSALEELYWKYNARIYNFAYSLLYDKSLAEDIVQSCFLNLWEKRAAIETNKDFTAYIYTIARNLIYRETERLLLEAKFLSVSQEQATEAHNETEEWLDASFIETHINTLIDQLPGSRKKIFLLSRKEGLSNREIAVRLALSEKTVETQIYRTLHFLKEKMNGYTLSFLWLSFFH